MSLVSQANTELSLSDVVFSSEVHKIKSGQGYFQSLYTGKSRAPVYLKSLTFYSRGPFLSKLNGKPQLFVPPEAGLSDLNHSLQSMCKENGQCPEDKWQAAFDSGDAWKNAGMEYVSIDETCAIFDETRKKINYDALGEGNYTVLIKPCGIFIGKHGSADHVASLQYKVQQILFEPATVQTQCML